MKTLVKMETHVKAPIDRCFDLSRSIDLHVISTKNSHERATAGRTSGLIALGETVTGKPGTFLYTKPLQRK